MFFVVFHYKVTLFRCVISHSKKDSTEQLMTKIRTEAQIE